MIDISLIAAVADNRVIGNGQVLPWHLPNDLKYFRDLTIGKPVIMGRLTFDSVGSPLPGRKNIVVSRSSDINIDDVISVNSIEEAIQVGLQECKLLGMSEVFIAGGAQIYKVALKFCTRIYITEVHDLPEGDILFPMVDWTIWSEVSRQYHDSQDRRPAHSFVIYEAKSETSSVY